MMFKLRKNTRKKPKEPVLYVQKQKEERNSGLQPALGGPPRVRDIRWRLGRWFRDDVVQGAVGRDRATLHPPFPEHDAAEAVGSREELRDAPRAREEHEVRRSALYKRFRGEAHRPRRS